MIRKILPTILATITGHARYLPEIVWSSNSWVHNIFRVYEMIFWRRYGIRAESAVFPKTIYKNGRKINVDVIEIYSFESTLAYTETWIRNCITKGIKFKLPYKIYVPILQGNLNNGMTMGMKMPSPYLFAIAIDTTVDTTATNSVSSKTQSHTCTGSNLVLWMGVGCSTSTVSTVTYNSVSSTKAIDVNLQSSWSGAWYNVAPSTGANNVVATCAGTNSITIGSMSFSGCKQTGVPDATHADVSQTGAVTSYSQSITTIADNCFIFMTGRANGGVTLTAGANTTVSQPEVAAMGMFIARNTNAITPAGTGTIAMTSGAQQFFAVMASFAPPAVASLVGKIVFPLQAINRASTY